jgi:hypothetical protein
MQAGAIVFVTIGLILGFLLYRRRRKLGQGRKAAVGPWEGASLTDTAKDKEVVLSREKPAEMPC